jgi:Ras-related protein Rab-1A
VIIGDSSVGKSCLLLRFADDTFTESFISTIGVDFRFRTLQIDGHNVKLQIWDTAGQERFRTITSAYYRGADGIMVVFDKTARDSFLHIDDWMEDLSRYSCEHTSKLLIGNKSDRESLVDAEEAENKARSLGLTYIETSAKTAAGVDTAFISMAKMLIKKREETGYVHEELVNPIKPFLKEKPKTNCC